MRDTDNTMVTHRELVDGTEIAVTCFYTLFYSSNPRAADTVTAEYHDEGQLADGTMVPLLASELEELVMFADDRRRDAQHEADARDEAAAEHAWDLMRDR